MPAAVGRSGGRSTRDPTRLAPHRPQLSDRRSRGNRSTPQDRRPPPLADGLGRGPFANRDLDAVLAAARAHRAGARTVRHLARHNGLRRLERCGGQHLAARVERRIGPPDGSHRRAPAVCRHLRTSDCRRLPVVSGRTCGGIARPSFGALRIECHGRCGEHRHAQDGLRRYKNQPPRRLRILQHARIGGDQPHPQRALLERRLGIIQPHGRTSGRHGIRTVRRLRPRGL